MKKWLYHFNIKKTITEVEDIKSKNDKGEEVVTKKETEKTVPVTFSIRKPNRRNHEDGELYYAVKLSEGIKSGLLTRPLLAKRYKNDGGPMSENEKRRYAELYYEMLTKQEAIEKLKLNLDGEDEDRRNEKAAELLADLVELREEIQEYELAQNSLFDQTAEKRAQNQTIMWWVLSLAHEKIGNDHFPLFGDGDIDSRLEKYDEIEERDDVFWTEVVRKFAYFITFWYLNGITKEEEFKEVENIFRRDNNLPSLEEEAGGKSEETQESEDKAEEAKEETEAEEAKEEPKAEEPKAEEPKAEEPKEEPKAEEPKEEPKAEEPKEDTKAEEAKKEPKAEEAKPHKKKDHEGREEKGELVNAS